MRVRGGKPYYGQAIGIAIFDHKTYPMVPGDVGNASTYDFPVRLQVIRDLDDNPFPPVRDAAGNLTPAVRKTVDAVRRLEADGVRAVVTCCGFFSLVQDILAAAVSVPVFTSPLLLVPLIARMIGPERRVGIITASAERLTTEYLEPVGITPSVRVAVAGLEASDEFYATHMGGTRQTMDVDRLRDQVVAIARRFVARHPDLGAVVLECTTLPTFAADIQQAVKLPVFDYVGFINLLHRSVVQQAYDGFL